MSRVMMAVVLLLMLHTGQAVLAADKPKSLAFFRVTTRWNTGKLCSGNRPLFAKLIAKKLKHGLQKQKAFQVISERWLKKKARIQPQRLLEPNDLSWLHKKIRADYYLTIDFRCDQTQAELRLDAFEAGSSQVVWQKRHNLGHLQAIDQALDEIVGQLKSLSRPDKNAKKSPLMNQSVLLFPLVDKDQLLSQDQLQAFASTTW